MHSSRDVRHNGDLIARSRLHKGSFSSMKAITHLAAGQTRMTRNSPRSMDARDVGGER